MDTQGVYLSRIFPESFLKPIYLTMVSEKFKSVVLRSLENTFVIQKIEFEIEIETELNSPSGSYHYASDKRQLPIPPE